MSVDNKHESGSPSFFCARRPPADARPHARRRSDAPPLAPHPPPLPHRRAPHDAGSSAAILAAANPSGGHYNKTKTVAENLEIGPALLSRFDLVFILPTKGTGTVSPYLR